MSSAFERRGFIGIDVDSLHHYYPAAQAGAAGGSRNPVWEWAVPRFLEVLGQLNLRATFFVVAQDVENRFVRRRLLELFESGHEVASHTYSHPQSLSCLSPSARHDEVVRSRDRLSQVVGVAVEGFRAPAWGMDETTMRIVEKAGFRYDSSVMPCSLLPAMKLAYWLKSRGEVGPRQLLGRWHHALAPLEPYFPDGARISRRGGRGIVELPIAVMPWSRLPFWHTIHMAAARWGFFEFAYRQVRRSLGSLHYQCHAVDLIDFDRDSVPPEYQRMFGLSRPLPGRKLLLKRILQRMARDYRMIPACQLSDLARAEMTRQSLAAKPSGRVARVAE